MEPKIQEKEYDIFRDSSLRYLGYSNELGESFRYQFPKFVKPSYALAFTYVLGDAATSGHAAYERATKTGSPTAITESIVSTMDTLLWQSLASVAIPGATINAIVRVSRFAVHRSPIILPMAVSTWFPTAAGLVSIPVIIKPIDEAVDVLMDSTFRQIQWINSVSND